MLGLSKSLTLFFPVVWSERCHVLKSWLELSQAPSSDASMAVLAVGPETGVSGDCGVTVGGQVTPRVPDAEDRALYLKTIPRESMDFCHNLLMLGTGCVL